MLNGRLQLGLNAVTYYNELYPFINVWKCAGLMEVKEGATTYHTGIPPGVALSPWDAHLDADGELVNPLPSGVTQVARIYYAQALGGPPAGLSRLGQEWVLKFDGTSSTITTDLNNEVRVGNRITGTWGNVTGNKLIRFNGIDHNDPPRNIRLCEARFESLLDAGEVLNPDYVERIKAGSGVIRFMNMSCINDNRAVKGVSDIPTESYFSWSGDAAAGGDTTGLKVGVPISVLSALANAAESVPWVCIPNAFGVAKTGDITGITNANPAVVSAPGHNFVNGDPVIPYFVFGMSQVNKNTYTVANAVANTSFELSGIDSTAFGVYSADGRLTSPISLSAMTAEVTTLATHFRDNCDTSIFEYENEHWNAQFDCFHWNVAQAAGTFAAENSYKQYGYLAAHCMKTIRDVYGVGNRQRWKGILGSQSANTQVTIDALVGVNQYITTLAPGLTVADLFDDLAITGYVGSPFIGNDGPHACTMSSATSFVTDANHNRNNNAPVKFATTDTLLSPLVAGTIYYIINRTTSTYQVAATPGGAAITLSGSQVGTHTATYAYADVTRQWMNDSEARFLAALEPTKYTYFNRLASEEIRDGRHIGTNFTLSRLLSVYWAGHKTLSDVNGLGLTQYEGGPDYALQGSGMTVDAQYLEFWPNCIYTDEIAANALDNYQNFVDLGGHHPSQYVDIAPTTIIGAYGALRYLGSLTEDDNPRWDAVLEFNNPGASAVSGRSAGGGVAPRKRKDEVTDPVFYDYWRNLAAKEAAKLNGIDSSEQPLPPEIVEALADVRSLEDVRALEVDAAKSDRAAIRAAIAEYQRLLDEDDDETVLLLMQ